MALVVETSKASELSPRFLDKRVRTQKHSLKNYKHQSSTRPLGELQASNNLTGSLARFPPMMRFMSEKVLQMVEPEAEV